MGRSRTRRTGVIALLLLLGSTVAALVLYRRYHLSNGATLVGLVGGVTGLTGLWLTWAAFKADREEAAAGNLTLPAIADQLAIAVRRQWEDEAALRRLNDPYPLPVRWAPASSTLVDDWGSLVRLATSGAGWPPAAQPVAWATGPGGLGGGDAELVGLFDQVPTGRLVVLGEPGAGKTILIVRLVLGLLAEGRRASGGPVPVLVTLASWNPREQTLYQWLEQRLAADYPGLAEPAPGGIGGSRARALLDAGLILPVLDGLDEIPDPVRGATIARINDALRPGQRVVLSSRTVDYQQAISPPGRPEIRLTGATGIELRPLDVAVVADYLRGSAGGPAGVARWDPLLAAWPPPVAQALTTPLMASLARTIYNPRPGEPPLAAGTPVELLDPTRFPTSTAVAEHLFDAFIAAAYRPHPDRAQRCPWPAADAERWLIFLARHLEHLGTPDLAWWQLSHAQPPWQRRLLTMLVAWLVAGLAFGLVFGLVFGLINGLIYGFAAGLAVGLAGRLTGGVQPPRRAIRWRAPSVARLTGGLVLTFVLTFVLTVVLPTVLLGVIVIVLPFVLPFVLVFVITGVPADLAEAASSASILRLDRAAFRSLVIVIGLVVGLAVGLPFGLAGGLGVGLGFGLAVGLAGGLAVGLGQTAWGAFVLTRVWLAARGRIPFDLMAFLADAHEKRGVLRQVGAVYQFRHIELQRRLATR